MSTIGFLILIALIWFVGPFAGLRTVEARFAWIFCVMLLWVITLMIGRALTDRAGGVLEKFLRRQADDAVMGASPEKRTEVARLRQRMLSAIDTLKNSNLGKARGKAALYELPWYMIIGHPAAGKSSAIQHSGLTFPFGDKQAVQGIGGTRDCDWFFSTEGVLLDTAGRYATQREDRGEWLEFLKLLKKYRSKAPVNGILVAISFPELVQFRSEQFALYARQVRERINEIDDAFGIKVPIYLVFTKIDLLGGFAQFFEEMTEEERHQVWGATLSHDQGAAFDAKSVVGQQFEALYRGLVQIGTEKLANSRDGINCPALFAFPIEFNAMRDAVCKFVELLFQEDPYHTKPLLRGFYFTSALQEGTPRIAAGARVSSQFDLSKSGFDTAQLPTSNGFFLRNLFKDVLFPDQYLVTRQVRPGSSRLRAAGIVLGVALLALLAGGLTWSYVGNQKLIASANEELVAARKLAESGSLTDRLKALQVLQLRLEQLYRYRKDGHPLQLGLSLYHGRQVEQILRAEYFAGVRSLMLRPVTAELERSLSGLGAVVGGTIPAKVPESASTTPVASPPPVENSAASKPRPAKKRKAGGGLPTIPINYRMSADGRNAVLQSAVFRFDGKPQFMLAALQGQIDPQEALKQASKLTMGVALAATSVGGQTQGNPMEDGYNALKTYLMLKHKEHMDVSHLSDQIPKYWRVWLDANKGDGKSEEIRRLAERVVAFYVSQIAEPDLPLIENREDLVASSREVLRGAMHRLSARERVYNELKARANTQFAPMTVGRILNNGDLTIVAGSYAVPGAFTREAWDKYFRNAIVEASRGEVKGDDWVLAAAVQDNLGKDGDVERNRTELEALYKADYAREWKKFLQGVTIQDFGTLEAAVQSLAKLSDAQNSAIKLIFVKAAYETAWDNPSALTNSIESAKNSVIERTEKLILGNDPAKVSATAATQYGELGAKFAALSAIAAEAPGSKMALVAYLEALAKLKGKIAQIAGNDADGAPRQLMQATLNGSGSELADALTLVDSVLLANASDDAKETIRPLLVRPLIQTYAALIPSVERELNAAWQAEVLSQWRTLSNKYPFADTSNEASMADIGKFLKPHEGTLPKFIEKNLAGLITHRGDSLVPRTWANLGVNFSPAFLAGATRLMSIGSSVLQEGDGAKFELQPIPTPGLSEIVMEIDGQLLRYRNGPQAWASFTWPNAANLSAQGARIQTISFTGVSTSVANFSGRLGWMRLLAQARVDNPSAPTVQLEWRLKGGRPVAEKVAVNDKSASSDSDGDVVRFNFRMVSGSNPLALSGLRRLGLPEKITN
jgi:type VI secretion system protein ImpL